MRYAIKVNQSEQCPEISRTVRDFIRALASEGHEVIRVFFYHDGVFEGFSSPRSDWADLANANHFELILCSQALDHRGLGLDVQLPFVVGGLALWVDACQKADRVLSFGGPSHAS